ncbi:MAG: hypothetical protein NXI23_26120 [Bacteroidetes bacterium]|jgi:hypothetical protein|nr:hypothetical protein [Bacteroidota bacterium]MDF1863536.1 hypothetical protein [Saprospiraceae bacterium]
MNINSTHTLFRPIVLLFFTFQFSITFSQPTEKVNSNTVFQIGKLLDQNKVSATEFDSNSGDWTWRFLFAEDDYKRKITPEVAKKLTHFDFTYNQKKQTRKGHLEKAKIDMNQDGALNIILRQMERNIRFFNKQLDVMKVDGKLYYLLYFPAESVKI